MRLAGTFHIRSMLKFLTPVTALKYNGSIKPLDDTPFGKFTAFSP